MSGFRANRSGSLIDPGRGGHMENASFDDLLQAVQSAFVGAQDSLRQRREAALRLRSEAEEAEGGQGSALTFAIPRNGGADDLYEPLTLPLSSFRMQRRPQVSMLSLSFACELEEKGFPGASRVFWLVIPPADKKLQWRKNRRRMQIVFYGTEQPCGEVRLDDDLLLQIPAAGAGGDRSAVKAKPTLLAKVLRMFRKLWHRQGFAMTPEQSKRVRWILAQRKIVTMPRGEVAL